MVAVININNILHFGLRFGVGEGMSTWPKDLETVPAAYIH